MVESKVSYCFVRKIIHQYVTHLLGFYTWVFFFGKFFFYFVKFFFPPRAGPVTFAMYLSVERVVTLCRVIVSGQESVDANSVFMANFATSVFRYPDVNTVGKFGSTLVKKSFCWLAPSGTQKTWFFQFFIFLNKILFRYRCNVSFECACNPGWKGLFCSEPICDSECHPNQGYCEKPGECR